MRQKKKSVGGARRRRSAGGRAPAARPRKRRAGKVLRARDLMTRNPVVVDASLPVGELCDLLQVNNVNGAPVVDGDGRLLGVVTQDDIIYGAMGQMVRSAPSRSSGEGEGSGWPRRKHLVAIWRDRQLTDLPAAAPRPGERPFWTDPMRPDPLQVPVSAIMTSPAIAAEESTTITALCRIMWNLRIHRVPILHKGKVTGLVSSMDLCRAILAGQIKL